MRPFGDVINLKCFTRQFLFYQKQLLLEWQNRGPENQYLHFKKAMTSSFLQKWTFSGFESPESFKAAGRQLIESHGNRLQPDQKPQLKQTDQFLPLAVYSIVSGFLSTHN